MVESRAVQTGKRGVERLVKNATNSLLYNKIFLSLIFLSTAIYGALENSVISYASFMLLLLFMHSFFFLQTVTYFFKLNFDLLHTLPLTMEDIRKTMLLTFLRIFDIPMLINLLAFPVAVAVFHHWYSAFPAFGGVLLTEIFSVALVTYLSRIFYTKLSQPSGGWKSVIRVLYQVIWGATFFLFYASMMWMRTLYLRLSEYEPLVEKYSLFFKLIFPFNFSYLIAGPDLLALASSILFLFLAYISLRWTLNNIGRVKELHVETTAPPEKIRLKITTPIRGMIRKDLKLISRNPGLLMLALLPAFESILLMALGNSSTSSLYVVFTFIIILIYTLFGFEKQMIMKILPITKGKVYLSKDVIGLVMYLISLCIVDAYLIYRGTLPNLAEQLALIPAVFSAGIVCLYLGDLLGLRKSVGVSALGFVLIIALGNVMLYLPSAGGTILQNIIHPAFATFLFSMGELGIGILILRTAR